MHSARTYRHKWLCCASLLFGRVKAENAREEWGLRVCRRPRGWPDVWLSPAFLIVGRAWMLYKWEEYAGVVVCVAALYLKKSQRSSGGHVGYLMERMCDGAAPVHECEAMYRPLAIVISKRGSLRLISLRSGTGQRLDGCLVEVASVVPS